MKTNELNGTGYESPQVTYHCLQCEGILCQSQDERSGGFDDFDFDDVLKDIF